MAFFPWRGVNPTFLHLKEGLCMTHHQLNITMVKKMKKREKEEKSQLIKHIVMAGIKIHELCLQSQRLYPLDYSPLPMALGLDGGMFL